MKVPFTANAEYALNSAMEVAYELNSGAVGTEHLLIGLATVKGTASKVLKQNGVDRKELVFALSQKAQPEAATVVLDRFEPTPRLISVMENSYQVALRFGMPLVGTTHLLIALMQDSTCYGSRLMYRAGLDVGQIYIELLMSLGLDRTSAKNEFASIKGNAKKKVKSETPVLDQYARDLNALAREGKLDPVVMRESEILCVIQILSRRTKNNPCLIGEPGVGKTAIAEGLAQRIEEGNVPENIQGKRILTLDMSGMVAGSKYRGEFEERMKRALAEAKKSGNILLFIDEIHTVIGAGAAEGSIDASNILKPSLARGELQVLGATTRDEYRKKIEKDPALERRFQPVVVEEPSQEQSIGILRGLREKYEEFHHVSISDEAILAAVHLSARYINDRYLPDKAIDLMDEAAAAKRLLEAGEKSDEHRQLEQKLRELSIQKEDAIIKEDYKHAIEIKEEQENLQTEIKKIEQEREAKTGKKKPVIGEDDIARVVAAWTKIPVQRLAQAETERLRKLEEILHERVVGQDEAVKAVAKAIRRGRVGLKDPKRPIGSFLFLGPTGVGKTELSKALAEAVFGSEDDMIRVDMSEYMESHSVSKMVGSPPGYVGYEEGGQLSEKIRQKPYSVLLFDEVEKAHPDVFNILLQILEDGHITDAQGRKVSFKNTIIIMTSNAGANRIISPKTLGFGAVDDEETNFKKMKDGVMEEVKKIFKPEFINRIDEIIVFHALSRQHIRKIVNIMVDNLKKRVNNQMNIHMQVNDKLLDYIVKKGFDKDYGARPLRRAIQTEIEDKLAEELLDGNLSQANEVELDFVDGHVIVK